MRCFGVVQVLQVLSVLAVALSVTSDDKEPHTYTVSFFQFNPQDLTGEAVKKESKKDIKPSDTNLTHHSAANMSSNNETHSTLITNATSSGENTTFPNATVNSNVSSHSHWNTTDGNKTEIKNSKEEDKTALKGFTGKTQDNAAFQTQNSTANGTTDLNNITATTNATQKRSHVKHHHGSKHVLGGIHKKNVLNPNPSPTQTEASKHLKSPEYDSSLVKSFSKDSGPKKNLTVFQANDSLSSKKNGTASLTEKSVTLQKTGDTKESEKTASDTKESEKTTSDTKKMENGTSSMEKGGNAGENVAEPGKQSDTPKENKKAAQTKNIESAKNETSQHSKLEKDKKINMAIQQDAMKIHPVENLVENTTSNDKHDTTNKGQETQEMGSSLLVKAKIMHGIAKNHVSRQREIVSHFVPVYDVTPRDRQLGFQLGSLKHPRHNIYPKCYFCPKNSTYSQCVRKSTLKTCKQGLNNICFTRSVKTHDKVKYHMGCADHKKCNHARAFPCKDGSKQCFTCCQFDRCNSSPHHGDYELDELNMDELELDTKSESSYDIGNWMFQLCMIIINVLVVSV